MTVKTDPLIRANILARQKKYEAAIRILENEGGYSSFTYYYLLGLCYLYSRAYGKALTNFRKAREIKLTEPLGLLGLAALYLNHGDTDRAVDTYLEILEIDEHNRIASNALKVIRKYPDNITSWVEKGHLHTLFPPFPKVPSNNNKGFLIVTAIVLGTAAAAAAIAAAAGVFNVSRNERGGRTELELLSSDLEAPMQLEGSFRYILTRDQVNNYYNEARRLFTMYRDESARVNLNRILESNGPEPVKNKARLLLSYLETPGFDSLRDSFSYAEIEAEPVIYRDCHVKWRGIAANLEIGQNNTSFDFLVGYDTRRSLEGTVRVDFDFAIAVNPERPVEILGRIVPVNTDKGISFRVHGIALNQAGLLNQPDQPK